MKRKLRDWVATPAEARTAWVVVAGCLLLIIVAFVRPLIRDDVPPAAVQEKRHAITAETMQDERKQSHSIEKIIEKSQQAEPQKKSAESASVAEPKVTAVASPPSAAAHTNSPAQTAAVPALQAAAGSPPKGYYVQLGAFSKAGGAESLQKKLEPTLGNTYLKKKSNGMTAVWAGPYATSKEAERAKADIAKRTNIKGYTVSN